MIFRLTQKLSKKIGIAALPVLPPDRNPFADWSAHLFTVQRVQYIILTNATSLYSMVMHGRGMSDEKKFIQGALNCMKEFMTIEGNKDIFEKSIEFFAGDISFSKITDRSVLGSMNDFIFQAKVALNLGRESLIEISRRLNESPMSYLTYSCPRDAFRELGSEKTASPGNSQRGNNVIYIDTVRPPTTRK